MRQQECCSDWALLFSFNLCSGLLDGRVTISGSLYLSSINPIPGYTKPCFLKRVMDRSRQLLFSREAGGLYVYRDQPARCSDHDRTGALLVVSRSDRRQAVNGLPSGVLDSSALSAQVGQVHSPLSHVFWREWKIFFRTPMFVINGLTPIVFSWLLAVDYPGTRQRNDIIGSPLQTLSHRLLSSWLGLEQGSCFWLAH